MLSSYFGPDAVVLRSAFETPWSTFEHDILLLWNRRLLVVEAKASPMREPFRDPDRAYIRIKRDFAGESGIQHAYDQANRLRRRVATEATIPLYDRAGALVFELAAAEVESTYVMCLTADNFGPLAIDLSNLLVKAPDEDYPLAINVADLETLLGGLRYRGWAPTRFFDYLDQRMLVHGKVSASDEMELGGMFVTKGTLAAIIAAQADCVQLEPSWSDVFDDIWRAGHGGPPAVIDERPVQFEAVIGSTSEVGNALDGGQPEALTERTHIGRNERCWCGSGRKYKRCHGPR